jgi:hypothetical protein
MAGTVANNVVYVLEAWGGGFAGDGMVIQGSFM